MRLFFKNLFHFQTEVTPVSAKRQMVLGEPRNKSRMESKLFLVRKLHQPDAVIGDTLVDPHNDGLFLLP